MSAVLKTARFIRFFATGGVGLGLGGEAAVGCVVGGGAAETGGLAPGAGLLEVVFWLPAGGGGGGILICTFPLRAMEGAPVGEPSDIVDVFGSGGSFRAAELAEPAFTGLGGADPFMLTEEPIPEPVPPREAGIGILTVSVLVFGAAAGAAFPASAAT